MGAEIVTTEHQENTLHIEVGSRKQFTGEVPNQNETDSIVGIIGTSRELISDKKMPFTHELCYKHLELKEFSGERGLEDSHVSYLIGCMQSGTFLIEQTTLVSSLCEQDGLEYRMNGQHTCWARLAMPVGWAAGESIRYHRYRCNTLEDMRILYASIDRGRQRTRGMIMHSYLGGSEDFSSFKKSSVKLISIGLPFWLWHEANERNSHSADDVAALMLSEHKSICSIAMNIVDQSVISGRNGNLRFMKRASIGAAILETASRHQNESLEFWKVVGSGVGITNANDPRRRLRDTLMNSTLNRDSISGSKLLNSEAMYRACIHAWNAYRKGEELQFIKTPLDSKRPKAK